MKAPQMGGEIHSRSVKSPRPNKQRLLIFWNCAKVTRVHPRKKTGGRGGLPGNLAPLLPPSFKIWKLRRRKGGDPHRGQRQSRAGTWPSRGYTDQLLDGDLVQVAEAQVQLVAVQLVAEVPALATGLGHGDAGRAVPAPGAPTGEGLRSRSSVQGTRTQPTTPASSAAAGARRGRPPHRPLHSEPRAPLPPVPPRRRPLPCPRHLPRPLRRAGPERPWLVRERPLPSRRAHCSGRHLRKGGVQSCEFGCQWPNDAPPSLAAPGGERARDWEPKDLGYIPR